MKTQFLITVLFLIIGTALAQQEVITKACLLDKVRTLSSKEFDGRLPGSEGYRKAVNYAEGIFNELRLKHFGEDYSQTLYVEYNNIKAPAEFTLISPENKQYKLGTDYIFRGFTGSGKLDADVVFCGYGISTPLYDDYKNIDVKGKVVMVFKNQPSWKIGDSSFSNAYPREKSKIAADHGAAGIIFLPVPNDKDPQKPIGSVLHGEGEQNENFPQLQVSLETVDELLSPSGYTLKQLQTNIDSLRQSMSLPTGSVVHITATAEYQMAVPVENVIGYIEGSDPVT